MAKKRLNKKLLMILSLVGMAVVVAGVVMVVQYKFQDPRPYLDKAQAAVKEARGIDEAIRGEAAQIGDPEEAYNYLKKQKEERSVEKWREAQEAFLSAYKNARGNREVALETLKGFAEMNWEMGKYPEALKLWNTLLQRDEGNYYARRKIAEFYYERAKSMPEAQWHVAWPDIKGHADHLIKLRSDDAYGYVLKAHAAIMVLRAEATQDKEVELKEAEELLSRVLELDEKSVEGHDLWAQLELWKMEHSEDKQEAQEHQAKAESYLREAIAENPDDPQAYMNLYQDYLRDAVVQKILSGHQAYARLQEAQLKVQGAEREQEGAEKLSEKKLKELKDEVVRLSAAREVSKSEAEAYWAACKTEAEGWIERFAGEGEFYMIVGRLARMKAEEVGELGLVIDNFEKALACGTAEGLWYLEAAQIYRVRAAQLAAGRDDLEKSFSLLRRGLYLPEIMEHKGPGETSLLIARLNMLQEMVEVCGRLARLSEAKEQRERYLATGGKASSELQDLIGTDHPSGKVAKGTMAIASGDKEEAIKQLYEADRMLTLSGAPNVEVKRKLFEILRGTEHHSAAVGYAVEAIQAGLRTSEFFVQFLQAVLELPRRENMPEMLYLTESLANLRGQEDPYWQDIQLLKARILLRLERREEARAVLAAIGDKQTVLYRGLLAQAQEKLEDRVKAYEQLVGEEPAEKNLVASLFEYYLKEGVKDAGYYDKGRLLIKKALEAEGENFEFQEMQLILQEPDPNNISPERMRQIMLTVLGKIGDSYEREVSLGRYYQQGAGDVGKGQDKTGVANYREKAKEHFEAALKVRPDDMAATAGLFDLAIGQEDWATAEKLLGTVGAKDKVVGLLFEGNLKAARGQWDDAANRLEGYLQERPVSYTARGTLARIYQRMGRVEKAIEQARMAVKQNAANIGVNRLLVTLLHQRNQETGIDSLSLAQIQETIAAANRLLFLNPADLSIARLKVIYYPVWITHQVTQLKSEGAVTETAKIEMQERIEQVFQEAVNICRRIISREPSEVSSWRILGSLFYQHSQQVGDQQRRKELLQQGAQVYEEGLRQNPGSGELAEAYAGFLLEAGKGEAAERLMSQAMEGKTDEEKREAQLRLAQQYMYQKAYERAKHLIDGVLETEPDNRSASLLLAELYVQVKNYRDAILWYGKIRQREDSEQLMARHTELLLNTGQIEAVSKLLSEMEQKYPDYMGIGILRCRQEMYNGNYAAAVAYADRVLEKDAGNQAGCLLKSEALYYDQRYREALDCITGLRDTVSKDDNTGRQILARIYWSLSRRQDAINEMETAIRYEPASVMFRKQLITFLKQDSRWSDLEQLYKETIKLFPRAVELYLEAADWAIGRGDQLKQTGQTRQAADQYNQALTWIGQAWELGKDTGADQGGVLERLLAVMLKAGNYAQALKLTDDYLKQSPNNVMLLVNKSEAQYQLGKNQNNADLKREALKTFELALNSVSDKPELSNLVLSRVARVGDVDEVISWGKSKLAERPDWREMHLVLSNLYRAKGEQEQVISELLRAREKANERQMAVIDQLLSIAYQFAGQKDQAIVCYRRMLEKQPENQTLINNLAYTLLEQGGHLDEAMALAEKAYNLDRSNTDIMDTYAWVLLEKQLYEQAELIMRRAIQQLQREGQEVRAEFYYHLGQALAGQGNKEAARERMHLALDQITLGLSGPGGELLREKIMADLEKMSQ